MEGANGMETLGTVVTEVLSYVSDLTGTITSSPLLLVSVGIFVTGAAIGLAKRLIGA